MLLGFNFRESQVFRGYQEEVVEEEGMIIEAVRGKQTKKLDFTPAGLTMDDLTTTKEE
jgi:hypothetical protein